jgi:hypothetical protein
MLFQQISGWRRTGTLLLTSFLSCLIQVGGLPWILALCNEWNDFELARKSLIFVFDRETAYRSSAYV